MMGDSEFPDRQEKRDAAADVLSKTLCEAGLSIADEVVRLRSQLRDAMGVLQRVRYGFEGGGGHPPHSPTLDEMDRVLNGYDWEKGNETI